MACGTYGLDLVQPLRVGWYNEEVGAEYRLPDFGDPASLALVVGNTRQIWQPFVRAMRTNTDLMGDAHPVERYAMTSLMDAVDLIKVPTQVRWAHDTGRGMVAIQRMAHIAGLAFLSPARLSVHREFGPWIALRAAVIVEVEGPNKRPLVSSPCDACESSCFPAFKEAQYSSEWRLWLAVRDACPLGRAHRYGEDQIDYHYGKNVRRLRRSIVAAQVE